MNAAPFEFAFEDYPLAPATLYDVGGPAELALIPRTLDEAFAAYEWAWRQEGPKLILGSGSNVLIADHGFAGIVLITTELRGLHALGDDRFLVHGGVVLDDVLHEVLLPNNYQGVGGLSGIPGSVGGAIFMNAGTVNGSVCEHLESVSLVTPQGQRNTPIDASLYSYRAQTFCSRDTLILSGLFRFTRAEDDQRALYEHYIQRRKETQPEGNSCGSVFKNPEGGHAGRLIEACDLKGTRRGGAVISELHANFIVNDAGATCGDILGLIALAKRKVHERFGIQLAEEVKVIGG